MELLADHTTTTAADALDDAAVAVLPVGSTEQHGPALPLRTDHLVAERIARSLDRDDAVVLPTLPVGVSGHHLQFHGTLAASGETFAALVRDVVESVAAHGVRKVVVVNGHGGNDDALHRTARAVRNDGTAFVAPWDWWSNLGPLVDDLLDTSLGHADAVETSMVQYLAPELVREDALEAAEDGAADSWGETVHGATVGFDAADFTESGAVGNPTAGTAEAGERLFEAASEDLDALVDWLADQPFESLSPEPHR